MRGFVEQYENAGGHPLDATEPGPYTDFTQADAEEEPQEEPWPADWPEDWPA